MCHRAIKEDEYRAISVDEMGEFRLWNIFLKEKSSRVYNAPVLQQFQMANPEDPIDHIRYVFLPNDPKLSTSNYSNVVGVGTKLLQFVPEKHAKEFSPATCAIFSETSATVACGVKSALLKYDMSEGIFVNAFQNLSTHDLTALALDGVRGRRIYVGCGNGDLLIVNFGSGQVLERHPAHSRDITKIVPYKGARLNIFTASLDGKLKMLEEVHGSLSTHNTVESAFGDNVGVQDLEVAGAVKAVVALSVGDAWGVWSSVTFKRIMVVRESEPVTAMALLGCSGDARDKHKPPPPKANQVDKSAALREYLITVAISRVSSTVIYVVDCLEGLGSLCVNITHDTPLYLTQLTVITPPVEGSINYALSRIESEHDSADLLMVGGSDDGYLVFWNVSSVRERAEYHFREQFGYEHPQERALKANVRPGSAGAATAVTADTNEDDDASHNGSPSAENVNAVKDTYVSFLTEVAKGCPIKKRTDRTRMTDMRGWVSASEFGELDDASSRVTSMRSARMHKDSVNVMLDMADHGCMCTMAYDGYLRMVNMDMECLGEMALPNLTIKMKETKRRAIVPFPPWRFILERMPITDQHHVWAKTLVRYWRYQFKAKKQMLQATNSIAGVADYEDDGSIPESACALHESHQHVADLGDLALGGALEGSMSQIFGSELGAHMSVENVQARESILRDLAEPPMFVDGAPPVHIPTKLETKRAQALAKYVEFKGRQKKRMQDKMSSSKSEGSLKLPNIGTSPLRKSLAARHGHGTRGAHHDDDDNSEATGTDTLPSAILADMAISAPDEDLWKLAGADFGPADVPHAFSEFSLNMSFSEGCIDQEAHRILRMVGANENKADAFDRVAGTMLLRNPSMSTGVAVPELNNLRSSEVSFGSQKDMYSNAGKLMEEKNKSSSKSLILSRHAIMCARIEQNVKRVGSMVHNVPPAAARELPMPDFSRKIRSELSTQMAEGEAYMQTRLMESAQFTEKMVMRRENDGLAPIVPNLVPDYARVAQITKYIESKVGADINEETQLEAAQAKLAKSRNKANEMVAGNLKDGLESKLAVCIRRHYVKEFNEEKKRIEAANKLRKRHEDMENGIAPVEEKKDEEDDEEAAAKEKEKEDAQRPAHSGRRVIGAELTNRMLAPSYKVSDIQTFLDIFLQVDTDFSGDLDIDEWVKLITKGEGGNNATMTKQQARMIFLRFDKKGDGYLSIRDLVPIVFGKASKEQTKLIVRVLESEVVQKKGPTLQTVQPAEIDSLFEYYDIDSIGFVQLSLVRDRVRNMNLGDPIQFAFMETIKNMDDDDLVNSQEFGRLFKQFIVTDRRKKR
jgi:Ca2+-binding EF-hand superfamily protein